MVVLFSSCYLLYMVLKCFIVIGKHLSTGKLILERVQRLT